MSTTSPPTVTADTEMRLRALLRHNATFSALGGVVAAVAWVPLAPLMGVDQRWLLPATGVGLLGFAGLVWLVASRPADQLGRDALAISIADAGWVIASVAVVASGAFSAIGVALMLAQAAVVASFGTAQARLRRGLNRRA